MNNRAPILVGLCISILTFNACAQEVDALESESRNVASAFMGAANFVVGRIGIECLSLLGRLETPREYVNIWQERNAKYYTASTKYVAKKMEAADALGGTVARDAVLKEYSSIVRKEGEATLVEWIGKGNKRDGCQRAVMLIDKGILDVGPEVPIYQDLQALAVWSKITE
ncbi:hypothetical protein ACFQ2T_08960 [Methylophilus flavus]|uniref:Uncharacterized protein n=1 Tax=Methylophilus flavus TaxID=640084 RepID=A0ABW3PAW5_9PROT